MRHPSPLFAAILTLVLGALSVARGDDPPTLSDLTKVQPPGGAPLRQERGAEISVDYIKQATSRLEAAPAADLDRWLAQLERIYGKEFESDLVRQACRTYLVTHLSLAFDDLTWNARRANDLFSRAQTMPPSEAKAWKAAFEALLKKPIGQTATEVLDGGPAYAVPLVLIPVDVLHEGPKFSEDRSRKYLARLKQLTTGDVSLWVDKVDRFGGTDLDAAVNIVLLDAFFDNETFQRVRFRDAIAAAKKEEGGATLALPVP